MNGTITGKYILKQIAEFKAIKEKEEKEKAKTATARNIKAALNVNMEELDEDTLKRYEFESSKALGLIEEKEYVINIKFGSNSVGELKFTAFNRAEAEKKAEILGKFCESQYHEELKKIAKKRMDDMKAEEQEATPETVIPPAQ